MKIIIVLFLLFTVPFFTSELTHNYIIKAQEEELKEEEETKEVKKQEEKGPTIKKAVEQPGQKKTEQTEQEELKEEGSKEEVSEKLRYYREKYEDKYDKPFEIVWKAVKKSVADIICQISQDKYNQNEEGLYSGTIKSDFCVFSAGSDSTFDVLKKFSYELPVIRGGVWLNGRMQYVFKIKEESGGVVTLLLRGELSGFEDFVTHEVHFWKSNGYFESKMLERVRKNIEFVEKN